MVHTFTICGDGFLYDVESGSLYEVDALTMAVVDRINGKDVNLSQYTAEEIAEAESELQALKAQGKLFAPENDINISTYSKEIKALCLHISHDCNLRCEYCFADEGKYSGEREVMSEAVGTAAIDFLMEHSGNRRNLEVDFFGGEPLLNLGVVKAVVEHAKALGKKHGKQFKFTMTTNALLLNDDTIAYLNREMDNVVLSIDGRKETHDSVRKTASGKGSFEVALKNSLKFRSVRGDKSYYVRGTFTALNKDFFKDVLFLNDCGFDQISIEPVILPEKHRLALKKEDVDIVNNNYELLAKEYVLRRKSGDRWFNFFHFFIDMDNAPCLTKRLKGCGAGNEYLAVSPTGELYPCHQFVGKSEYKMGDVFDKQIDADIKERFASCNLLSKPLCKSCFAKYHCSGGCTANNINYGGGMDQPYEVSCAMMKKRLECALYAYAKEKTDR